MTGRLSLEKREFLRPPYVYLLLMSILFGVLTLVLIIAAPAMETTKTWLSRLTVSVFGAYLAATVIDLQIRGREESERRKQRNLALHQLHADFNGHLDFLCRWYIAASAEDDFEIPDSFESFFQDDYIDTVQHLDFSKECSGYLAAGTWFEASNSQMSDFKDSVDSILDKYGMFIESDLLSTLLKISENPLINSISHLDISMEQLNIPTDGAQNVLYGENYERSIEIHLEAVQELLTYYDDPDNPDIEPIQEKPAWGIVDAEEARIDSTLEDTDPSYSVRGLEEDRFNI